jgi:hypothetical protein
MGAYIHISSELSICSGQSDLVRQMTSTKHLARERRSVSVYSYLDLLLQEPDVVNCLLQHGADVNLQQCVLCFRTVSKYYLPWPSGLSKGMLA